MSWLSKLFSKVEGWFSSPTAQKVETDIEALMPFAVSIANEINAMLPKNSAGSRDLTNLSAITTKYGIPAISEILATPAGTGNVLLNLGTDILKVKAPAYEASGTLLLNTVMQLGAMAAATGATSPV